MLRKVPGNCSTIVSLPTVCPPSTLMALRTPAEYGSGSMGDMTDLRAVFLSSSHGFQSSLIGLIQELPWGASGVSSPLTQQGFFFSRPLIFECSLHHHRHQRGLLTKESMALGWYRELSTWLGRPSLFAAANIGTCQWQWHWQGCNILERDGAKPEACLVCVRHHLVLLRIFSFPSAEPPGLRYNPNHHYHR